MTILRRRKAPLPSWLSEDDARVLCATFHVRRIEEDRIVFVAPVPVIEPLLLPLFLLQGLMLSMEDLWGPYLLRLALRVGWIFLVQLVLGRFLPQREWVLTYFPNVNHHIEEHFGLRRVLPNATPFRETIEESRGRWHPMFPRTWVTKQTRNQALRAMDRLFPGGPAEPELPWQPTVLPDGSLPSLPCAVEGLNIYRTSREAFTTCNRDAITMRGNRSRAFIVWLIGCALLYFLVQGSYFELIFLFPFIATPLTAPRVIHPGLQTTHFDLTVGHHLISFATVAAYLVLLWLPMAWPPSRLEIPSGQGVLILKRFGRRTLRVPFVKSHFLIVGRSELYELGKPRIWTGEGLALHIDGTTYFLPWGGWGVTDESQARLLLLFSHVGWEAAVADHLAHVAAAVEERKKSDAARAAEEEEFAATETTPAPSSP